MSTTDPIMEELHRIREEISRESGDDLKEIAEAVRKRQAGKAPQVRLAPNRVAAAVQPDVEGSRRKSSSSIGW